MSCHELTDREWTRLEPLLPKPRWGRPPKDHRTIINALVWLSKTGAPWRDLPERYGAWQTVATRFYRWTRSALWLRVLGALQRVTDMQGRLDWEVHMVDGSNIRAHRHAAGARGGPHRQALSRSRGGFGSKLRLRCDRRGPPLALVLTRGERNERTALAELMQQGAVKRASRWRPKGKAESGHWRSGLHWQDCAG